MELLTGDNSTTVLNASLTAYLNYFVLRYLSSYFAVCVFTTPSDDIQINMPVPVVVISIDSSFNRRFQDAVDGGCQAFVVTEQVMTPFLDAFVPVHDNSDQRSSEKRLLVVMESEDELHSKKFITHRSLLEFTNVVIVVPNHSTESVDLYSSKIFNDGTRSTVNFSFEQIEGPDYMPDAFQNMNDVPVHLCTLMYPPFSYYEETVDEKANARYHASFNEKNVPLFLEGTEVTLIVEFCRKYNCSIEVSLDEEHLWGEVFDNRTGNGIMGMIVERRADIAVSAIFFLLNTYKFATYTHPLSRSGVTVLVPKPLIQPPWRTPFLCFSPSVWLAVIVAFCVGVLTVWSIEKVRFRILDPNEQPVTFSDSTMTMIRFYVEQSSTVRTDLMSCTLLFISLIFAGFMISNTYNGGLAGVMTIPQHEKSIDTVRDLADSGMRWGQTVLAWLLPIMTASQPYVKRLMSTYRVADKEFIIKHTKMHDMGFIGERTEYNHFVPEDFVDHEASTMLQLLKDDLYWSSEAAVVTKTCPFRQKLNDFIMLIKQSGIQYYWELQASHKYLNGSIQTTILNARSAGSRSKGHMMKLTVLHFVGAYMILAVGLGLASIVFLCEISQTRKTNLSTRRKQTKREG